VLSATTNSTSLASGSGTAKASATAKATSSPTPQIGGAGTILPGGLLALFAMVLHMTVYI
jgi:hypothetical protein